MPIYPLTLLSTSPLTGTASFPPTHPAFDGHFPNNPILPAFMQIQLALDLLALAKLPCQLHRVLAAKFRHQLKPDQLIHIFVNPTLPDYYDATLTVEGQLVSSFQIHIAMQE